MSYECISLHAPEMQVTAWTSLSENGLQTLSTHLPSRLAFGAIKVHSIKIHNSTVLPTFLIHKHQLTNLLIEVVQTFCMATAMASFNSNVFQQSSFLVTVETTAASEHWYSKTSEMHSRAARAQSERSSGKLQIFIETQCLRVWPVYFQTIADIASFDILHNTWTF